MRKMFLSAPGVICCAGDNKDTLYESCLAGKQIGTVMRKLPEGQFPTRLITWEMPKTGDTRILQIINAALNQIQDDVERAIGKYGAEQIGVCIGSCDNGSENSFFAHKDFFANGAFPKNYNLSLQSASFPAEYIAERFGVKGHALTVATACASGASAIARGAELIEAGLCKAVIVGGADIVSETALLGFHALEALSNKITNPSSKNRNGINLGEGAAFFLLSEEPGSTNIELMGYGESSDAFHMTAPGADGAGPAAAMNHALLQAGMTPETIDYVNMHGTGTPLNDKAEALAMETIFGKRQVAASSTKPITGHALGAAGALEAAICWMTAYKKKGFPLHLWDEEKDEELCFQPSTPPYNNKPHLICMSNSFAFGGCNVSLILGGRN